MRKLLLFILFVSAYTARPVFAQQRPFYHEILSFKKQDSINPPPRNAVLFIGSSSFTMWKDVQEYFPNQPIINRGFGGSSLTHLIHYFNDIVTPYSPRKVVVYCGENDLTDTLVTPAKVLQRFTGLFKLIRAHYPNVQVLYISIKPSPSRRSLMARMELSNQLIRMFLKKQRKTKFINVYNDMLVNGRPDPTLFLRDSLHLNAKGYALWKTKLEPHLKK